MPPERTDEALARRVASAIRAWMAYRKVEIQALSRSTGLSRQTLYRATGQEKRKPGAPVPLPRPDVLERIAEDLGTTAGTLLDGIGPDSKTSGRTAGEVNVFLSSRAKTRDRAPQQSFEALVGQTAETTLEILSVLELISKHLGNEEVALALRDIQERSDQT